MSVPLLTMMVLIVAFGAEVGWLNSATLTHRASAFQTRQPMVRRAAAS
jgi:hypothetical protein